MVDMKSAQLALQPAIYTLLTGDATLVALLAKDVRDGTSPGIFDAVPKNQTYPYLTIGEFESDPARTLSRPGEEVVTIINVYSQDNTAGAGNKVLLEVLEELNRLLGDVTNLTPSGYDFAASWYESSNIQKDVDNAQVITRQLVVRYRMLLHQSLGD